MLRANDFATQTRSHLPDFRWRALKATAVSAGSSSDAFVAVFGNSSTLAP